MITLHCTSLCTYTNSDLKLAGILQTSEIKFCFFDCALVQHVYVVTCEDCFAMQPQRVNVTTVYIARRLDDYDFVSTAWLGTSELCICRIPSNCSIHPRQ
jgi:hypothetical protein